MKQNKKKIVNFIAFVVIAFIVYSFMSAPVDDLVRGFKDGLMGR